MTAGQQEVQAGAEGQLSGPTPIPGTEEGLDNAMEELALEVRCALTHLWTFDHAFWRGWGFHRGHLQAPSDDEVIEPSLAMLVLLFLHAACI